MAGRQLSRGEPTVYERVSVSGTFRGPRRRRDCADRYLKSNEAILRFSLFLAWESNENGSFFNGRIR